MKLTFTSLILCCFLCLACDNIEEKAMKGNLAAQLRLAHCYETGDSIGIRDIEKAKFYYELAGKQGNLLSQKWMINYYDSINDSKNAFIWYEISANQGNKNAQHILGDYYKWGWGEISPDTIQAINWYQKAANQNDTLALFKMGELLIHTNASKGLEVITKAAELKSSDACRFLGNYYNNKKDYKKAMFWYEKEAEAGDPYGYYFIAKLLLDKEDNPTKRTIIEALNNYEIAYVYFKSNGDTGRSIGMANLVADMYELLNKQNNNSYILDVAEWRLKGNDFQEAGRIYTLANEWLKAYESYARIKDIESIRKLYQTCSAKLRKYKKTRDEWFGHETYELPNFTHMSATNTVSLGTGKNERISGAQDVYLELRVSVTNYQICSSPVFYYTNKDGLYTSFTIDINMNSVKSGVIEGWFSNTSYEYFTQKLQLEDISNFKNYVGGSGQKININNGDDEVIRELSEDEIINLRKMIEAYEMLIIVLSVSSQTE